MATVEFTSLPEELLERILSYCVIAPLSQPRRPSWHTNCSRGRLAPLLVCKALWRICLPLFYHTVHVQSASQLYRLLSCGLRPNPHLTSHIRRVVLTGTWAEAGELLRLCGNGLRLLEFNFDMTHLSPGASGYVRDFDVEEFCEGFREIKALTHLIVRKDNNVYLTQPKARYIVSELAKAMQDWNDLEVADLAFRLSDDSGSTMFASSPRNPPQQGGPISALTQSLAARPKLHTFCTLLPNLWNECILRVSANSALERIILGDGMVARGGTMWSGRDFYAAPVGGCIPTGPTFESGHGVVGTGLFFLQAKKHARLSELIRAGTSIIRTRAQTLGIPAPLSTNSNPSSPAPTPTTPRAQLTRSQTTAGNSSMAPSSRRGKRSPQRHSVMLNQPVHPGAWEYYSGASVSGLASTTSSASHGLSGSKSNRYQPHP